MFLLSAQVLKAAQGVKRPAADGDEKQPRAKAKAKAKGKGKAKPATEEHKQAGGVAADEAIEASGEGSGSVAADKAVEASEEVSGDASPGVGKGGEEQAEPEKKAKKTRAKVSPEELASAWKSKVGHLQFQVLRL